MQIRQIDNSSTEYAACAAISQPVQPEKVLTEGILRDHDKEMMTDNHFVRVIGDVDGQIVAHGSYWKSAADPDDTPQFNYHVRADLQDGPISARMQAYLIEQATALATSEIASEPLDSEQYRMRLLEADGFQLAMRFLRSDLDVEAVDYSAHHRLIGDLAQSGIKLCTLVEVMQQDPEWR